MKTLWQCVETYPDGTQLVRYTGSYAMCAYIAKSLEDVGFRADVQPQAKGGA